MIDHWSNKFRIVWASTLGPLGFLLNLLMGYIIFKYTSDSMKTYSTMIMVMTISDAVNGFCSIMASYRGFPTGAQIFVLLEGICEIVFDDKLTKSRFCMFCLKHINRKKIQLLTYEYSLIHFSYYTWVYFMSWSSLEAMDAEISKIYPELIGSNYTYSGVLDVNAPSQIAFNITSILTPVFVIFVALICKCTIERYLIKFTFTENKKRQHRSLVNVLLYQTISSFLLSVATFLYMTIRQTGDKNALVENVMSLSLVLVSVVSPIVSCILIAPYRTASLNLWSSAVSMICGVESRLLKKTVRTAVSVTNPV